MADPAPRPAARPRLGADARTRSRCSPSPAVAAARRGKGWAYEFKWDGVRAISYVEGGRVRLVSRNMLDITRATPSCATSASRSARPPSYSTGRSSPSTTPGGRASSGCSAHARARRAQVRRLVTEVPIAYLIFDVLYLDGHRTTDLTYAERRELLEACSSRAAAGTPRRASPTTASRSSRRARRSSSRASSRRSSTRSTTRVAAPTAGSRSRTSAARRSSSPAGRRARATGKGASARCSSASTSRRRAALLRQRRHRLHRQSSCAAGGAAKTRVARTARSPTRCPGCRPGSELRRAGAGLRGRVHRLDQRRAAAAPVVQGTARRNRRVTSYEVVEPGQREGRGQGRQPDVWVSNLDKVLYPEAGFTKGQVIDYYTRVAPGPAAPPQGPPADDEALPQRRRRPVLLREELPQAPARLGRRSRRCRSNGRRHRLLHAATPCRRWSGRQPRRLELHTSLSTRCPPGRPTRLVYDLDPGRRRHRPVLPGRPLLLRDYFADHGLEIVPQDVGVEGHAGLRAAQAPRHDVRADAGFSTRGRAEARAGAPEAGRART